MRSAAAITFSQSAGSMFARRNFSELTPATEDKIRPTSCSLPISREKNATVLSYNIVTFWAIFKVKAVFPIAGRAATRMRSDFCKPLKIWSTSLKPVGTPVIAPSCCCSALSLSRLDKTTSPMAAKDDSDWVWPLTSSTICSALLRIAVGSSSPAYVMPTILFPASMRRRNWAFSLMILACSSTL